MNRHELETYEFTETELKNLGDAIVWTTILAAVHNDGIVKADEKAEAMKQAHTRTFSGNTHAYLQPVYRHLIGCFEQDFDAYSATLPTNTSEQEAFIQQKFNEAFAIVPTIGPMFAKRFVEDLKNLYERVFHTGSSIFRFFAMPVISAKLQEYGLSVDED